MEKQQILDYVISYVKENHGAQVPDVKAHTKMITTRLIDSINTLSMLSHLEDKFKFEAVAEEVNPENLDTPELIATYIKKKLG